MAYYSIEKRKRTDGTLRYRCTVGVKEGGKYLYWENRTFSKQAHAKTWGAGRVAELETQGVLTANNLTKMTLGDQLKRYIRDPNLGGKAGRTKRFVLDMLLDCEIAEIPLMDLSTCHVIAHCRQRNGSDAGPSTVNHDVSYLSSVLASAKPVYGLDYTTNPATEARPILLQMGLIGKPKCRRPVRDELDRLLAGLEARSAKVTAKIPFVDILKFSILVACGWGKCAKSAGNWREFLPVI